MYERLKANERNIISCLLTFSAKFTLNFANSKKRDLPLNRIVSKRSVLGAEKVNKHNSISDNRISNFNSVNSTVF